MDSARNLFADQEMTLSRRLDSECQFAVMSLFLSEEHARALMTLTDFGVDRLMDALDSVSDRGPLPNRERVRQFLLEIDDQVAPLIERLDDARAVAAGDKARDLWI